MWEQRLYLELSPLELEVMDYQDLLWVYVDWIVVDTIFIILAVKGMKYFLKDALVKVDHIEELALIVGSTERVDESLLSQEKVIRFAYQI
jgi:hypothetical protein